MRNLTLISVLVLASACVTRTPDPQFAPLSWRNDTAEAPSAPASGSGSASGYASAPAPSSFAFAMPESKVASAPPIFGGGKGYTKFSLGTFEPAGDIDGLDTGYYGQVAFGGDVLPLISLEASLGYGFADGAGNSELTIVPLLFNGRIQVPILIVKVYGGIGVGGAFIDYKFGAVSDDQFLLAGTAFLGAEVGLGNLAVGLEYRYLATEETDRNFTVEGHCALLTLTLPF